RDHSDGHGVGTQRQADSRCGGDVQPSADPVVDREHPLLYEIRTQDSDTAVATPAGCDKDLVTTVAVEVAGADPEAVSGAWQGVSRRRDRRRRGIDQGEARVRPTGLGGENDATSCSVWIGHADLHA